VNRKQREAAKTRYEALRQSRSAAQARQAHERAQREALIQDALVKPARASRAAGLCAVPACLDAVESKAPRLIDPPYDRAVTRLLQLPALRLVREWRPRGKGRDTQFRSLADHLLAKFPVPAIVWNAFHDQHAEDLVPLAVHVAAGGSLYELVRTSFAIPLTRRMCHDLLKTPAGYNLLVAIRRVQSRAAGADIRFFEAWRMTRYAQQVGSKEDETFWYSVVEWFAKVPMLEAREIGPLCDYIDGRRREDRTFTMKGRSGPAMIRAMKEWHGTLTKEKRVPETIFRSSGYEDAELHESRREANGDYIKEIWRIKEVLTAKTLAEEGKRMGHCVYSYAWRIEKGDTSIWSVQMEDGHGETGRWHMVTMEVRNDLRRVVQVRGRYNRSMTSKELRIVTKWAGINNLQIALGPW